MRKHLPFLLLAILLGTAYASTEVGTGGSSIGGAVSGGTAGSVYFGGTAGALSQDNANFFWDDTNNRLGVGTATPAVKLDVYDGTGASNVARFSGTGSQSTMAIDNPNQVSFDLYKGGALQWQVGSTSSFGGTAPDLYFYDQGGSIGTTLMSDGDTGYVGIGNTSPGERLHVSGNIRADGVLIANDGTLSGFNLKLGNALQWQIGSTVLNGTRADLFFYRQDGGVYAVIDGDTGNLGVGTDAPSQKLTVEGTLGLLEGGASPSFHTVFQGGDQAADITYTLPVDDGDANEVLKTDGAGATSWGSVTWEEDVSTTSATCSKTCSTGKATGGGCTNSTAVALQKSYQSGGNTWNCEYATAAGDCTAQVSCF